MDRISTRYCTRELSQRENEAAVNAVSNSVHTRINMLPNHHMNSDGELCGFSFTCNRNDMASVLPLSKKTCAMTSVYECISDQVQDSPLNDHAIRIVKCVEAYRTGMKEYVRALKYSEIPFASFSCIPDKMSNQARTDSGVVNFVSNDTADQTMWSPDVPQKFGVYHAFTRNNSRDTREHKIFIVVSGCLTHAAEELYNLWQDGGEQISCGDFLESQELQWLRKATHRSHNRIAADMSKLFGLKLQLMMDMDCPSRESLMAFPTTCTYMNDIVPSVHAHEMHVSESACFVNHSDNGVILDLFSSEGYWMFQGPRDYSSTNNYGSIFGTKCDHAAFPTTTVRTPANQILATSNVSVRRSRTLYNTVYIDEIQKTSTSDGFDETEVENENFIFPDEHFMRTAEKLGFNRNDGILSLMPLVCFIGKD